MFLSLSTTSCVFIFNCFSMLFQFIHYNFNCTYNNITFISQKSFFIPQKNKLFYTYPSIIRYFLCSLGAFFRIFSATPINVNNCFNFAYCINFVGYINNSCFIKYIFSFDFLTFSQSVFLFFGICFFCNPEKQLPLRHKIILSKGHF